MARPSPRTSADLALIAPLELTGFDAAAFLRDHWQKTPLLIRDPWTAWRNPLDPDELAGLAGDDGVEARLIRRTSKTWKLEHGPFAAKRFAKLGKQPWTLLVQAVDHAVPAVAALIAPFRFVPNWRIDDVMVSYASDGGGVGPHFDQYDVFLIQGLGQRRWRIGGRCDAMTPLLPHDDLRLLERFEATAEWVLGPGDILYLPPGVAHDGVAVGDDCMTYSIGFRAPSRSELIAHWTDDILARLDDDDRYADPDLAEQLNPGEIGAHAIDRLHAMVTEALLDREAFARWFGEYTSERKNPDIDFAPHEPIEADEVRDRLAGGVRLIRNPASRFSFIRTDPGALLFVDGRCFDCVGDMVGVAERLCASDRITIDRAAASDTVVPLIATLLATGSVAVDEDA